MYLWWGHGGDARHHRASRSDGDLQMARKKPARSDRVLRELLETTAALRRYGLAQRSDMARMKPLCESHVGAQVVNRQRRTARGSSGSGG
jgi:hypothetical protein